MAVTKFGFQIASGLDSFYLTDSKYIKGTYTVVDGVNETKEQLQVKETIVEGSLVFDAKEAKTYRWTNNAWVEEQSGSGSGIIVCDSINDLPSASEHVGQIAYVKDQNSYFGSNGTSWDELHHKPDLDYTISDPQRGDILVYDASSRSWKNVKFDGSSLLYDGNNGVGIYKFPAATEGQIPTKHFDANGTSGIEWVDPLSQADLDAATEAAEESAKSAMNFANAASVSSGNCEVIETRVNGVADRMIEVFNKKFWWGTEAEFNALPGITQDTVYFIEYIKNK